MKATLRKCGILLATLLTVVFSFNYSNAQITGASAIYENGTTPLVAPSTTISAGTSYDAGGSGGGSYNGGTSQINTEGVNTENATVTIAQIIGSNILNNAGLSSTSQPSAAFSFRKLSSTYTGFAANVRRASDNAQANVAFDGNGVVSASSNVTITASGTSGLSIGTVLSFSTFYGSTSCYVTTWYDQTGAGINAIQLTNANQPRIVNAGVLEMNNGKVAMTFQSTSQELTYTAGTITVQTINAVRAVPIVDWQTLVAVGADQDFSIRGANGNIYNFNLINGNDWTIGTSPNAEWVNGQQNLAFSSNYVHTITENSLNAQTNTMSISTSFAGRGMYGGTAVNEIILLPTTITTTEQQNLEANQSVYYVKPAITSFTPTISASGSTVTITGNNFNGTTAVSLGGVAASSYTVVNATTITAVVATGASGSVSVTTPGGNATLAGFRYLNTLDKLISSSSTTATAAYSTRKLSSLYSGPSIKVRRASDNAEANVAFDASGSVSASSLVTITAVGSSALTLNSTMAFSTFYAATNCYVNTLYDQSGNGSNTTQATFANQPLIVSAGVINTSTYLNGKPALSFDAAFARSMSIPVSASVIDANGTFATVHSQTALQSGFNALLSWSSSNSTYGPGFAPLTTAGSFGLYTTFGSASYLDMGPIVANKGYVMNAEWTGSGGSVTESKNGTAISGSVTQHFVSTISSGLIGMDNGTAFTGSIPEIVVFNTALSTADRQSMETNQIAYYTPPTITSSSVSGTIVSCVGTASVSPSVQQFSVSGINLTANITATAPAGFEISTAATSGFSSSVILAQTNGTVNSTTLYVRSAASASAGSISGNVALISGTASTVNMAVSGTVNALLAVTAGSNSPVLVNGTVNLTATGADTYSWTGPNSFNSTQQNPAISNAGNLATGKYTVTGTATTTGCAATATTYVAVNKPFTAVVAFDPRKVTSFAGSGISGATDGTGAAAQFNNPSGIAIDASGNLYVSETSGNRIRKITAAGVVTTVAGSGVAGYVNGTGTTAKFSSPRGVALDPTGTILYVADNQSYSIRKIDLATGAVTTYAGTGTQGNVDGPAATAKFVTPTGVTVDALGNVYVADLQLGNRIRKISTTGIVSTVYTGLTYCSDIIQDLNGNFISTAMIGYVVEKVSPDSVKTRVAGSGTRGSTDGPAATATFNFPMGLTMDAGGNIFLTENDGNHIRKITPGGNVTTLAGSGSYTSIDGIGTGASIYSPNGVVMDAAGNLFVTEYGGNKIRKLSAPSFSAFTTNTGTASAVQQINISGASLSGNITVTAPAGFEVSLSSNASFASSITVAATANEVASTIIYIRLAAAAATGVYNGNLSLSASGATTQTMPLNGTVSCPVIAASITAAGSTSVCVGSTVTLNANTGTGYTYQWSKDALSISGATAGTYTATSTGSYTVVITGTGGCVSTVSNAIAVTIQDILAPTFTSTPANINATATSANGAVVTYALPTAVDNCTISPIVSGLPASGSVFPIGTTLVSVTATDATGNSTNTTFNIIVSGTVPVIIVPANSTLNATSGQCTATATFAATETTGIPSSTITYSENGSPISSGTALSVGVHTITATATNTIGFSTGTFTVTVKDIQAPTFNVVSSNAPASILANVPEAAQYKLVYQLNIPDKALWSSQAQIPYTVNNAASLAGASFNRVAYYMELDNGKWVWVSMDKFTSDPSLLGIPTGSTVWQQKVTNMNVVASANAGVTAGTNIATGNIELWSHCYTTTNGLGLPGANTNTYDFDDQITAQNCYGSFQVHNYGAKQTLFAYNRWAENANNYSDLGIGNNTGNTNPDWTFMSNANTITNKKIYVFISGAVMTDINANTDLGLCSATVNVPTPTATDFCGSATVTGVRSDALALTAAYPKGTTTITWTANDASSNATTTTQKVIVTDNEAPVIAGPSNITVNATSAAGAVVSYATPTATDNCPSVTVAKTAGLASGSTFPIGVSTITYIATDAAGLTATYTFTITVAGVAPVIVVPANFDVNTTVGACTAIVNFAVTDATGIPASTITYTEYGLPTYSGYMNDVGTHTITATATNVIGSSSNTFTFTVHDVTPPQFVSSATILTANVGGAVQATSLAGAVVNFTLPAATDNCANAYVSSVPVSGSVFPLGVSTVVVTATDPSGNSTQTTFTVTVVGVAPSIVIPSTVTVNNTAGLCSAVVSFAATDPTGVPASIITYDIQPGSVFNVGTTKVTATATNELGSSSLSFDVVVKDSELPKVFTKDPTIYIDANGQATLTVAQVDNGSTDNCAIANKTISKTLFNCSDVGKAAPNVSALKFNGSGVAYIPSLIPGGNNFSFSTWFFGNDASNGKIISSNAFEICLCGSSIEVFTPYGGAQGVGGAISLNKWHQIAVTYSAPLVKVYIDGILKTSFNTSQIGGISGAVIGRHVNGCCPLFGTLDEMSFWNITLSASQIAAMQTKALKGDEAGLTAYYNFDEATGTTIIDRSGNHHNIVLNGLVNPWTTAAAPIANASSNTVTLTVTDASGNIATGTATVTVLDAIAPIITCPGDLSASTDAGKCFATVAITTATATDNCSVKSIVGVRSDALALSSSYPKGITTIVWTATDASDNKSTCTQTITVTDNEAPVIKAIADISATATSADGATVNYIAPVGTDNCPGASTVMTAGLASGSTFPIGTTLVTYTVTDASGLTASTSFNVIVTGIAPVIVKPTDINIPNDAGQCGAIVNFEATETTAIPASTITYTENEMGVTPGSFFAVGTHTITATATNDFGSNSVDFIVTIYDNEKPVLRKAFDWGREGGTAELGKCGTSDIASLHLGVPGTASTFQAFDNCGPTVITSNAPTFFPVGVTIVTYTVTDIHGNFSTIDEEVTVSDFEPPVIAAVADINVNATSAAGAVVNYTAPVGTDNCSVATTVMTAGLASGSTFPIGTTTVTYRATDASGNSTDASFNVTVTGIAPVIVAPDNYLVNSEAGKCGASVNFAATETTAIPASTIAYTENGAAVVSEAYFTVGTHTITATATNAVGSNSVDFTITVVDHELPTVLTQAKTIYLDASGHASISVADINNGSTDNCAIDQIALDKTAFDCSNLGANTVNLTVTDIHGNVNSATAIVTVQDLIAPVLSAAPADAIVECNAVPAAAVLTATDNCSATVTYTETRINGKSKNDYTLTRTWTATDAAGNSVSKTQTIIVQDTKAPILAVPINISVNTDNNVCGATINFAATATDNCAVPVITYSQNPNTVFPVGITTVTVTATDASGNISTGSFTITVKDKQAPVAIAKNITVGLSAVGGTATITAADVNNGSSDACGIASMTVVPASFSCATIGANKVTLTVTDVNGNVSTTTAIVTVVDDKGPVPTVATLPVITGQCYATALTLKPGEDGGMDDGRLELDHYYLVVPTAMDNCSGLAKGTTTDPLTYYNQGTYTIHWKYVDAKGNVTIQLQTVVVKDTYAPVPKRATLPTLTGQCSVNVASGSNSDDDGEDNDGGDDDHGKAPWAFDNCSGWIMGTTTSPLTFTVQGTYTIDWTFDDGHGNISHQYQAVIVKDITAPRAASENLPTITGQCSASVTTAPTAIDNCVGTVIGTTTDPLTYNAQGTYTIHWTYSDGRGNTSIQNQQVVVKDNIKPILTLPASVTGLCVGMSTDPSATGTATATDNCSGIVTVTYTDQKSGTSISRTWRATDASGNTATAVQQISFSAAYTASITSVPTSNVNTGGSSTSLFLGYGAQSTALTVTGLPSSGAPYTYQWTGLALGSLNSATAAAPLFAATAAGNYQFSVTVTNKNGCTAFASINICVKDVRVPGSNGTKVYVCHTASGKVATPQTLEVLISQVASHLNGNCGSKYPDVLGSCNQGTCDPIAPVVTSVDPKLIEVIGLKADATAVPVEDLKVTVMPNPSTTYFTLKFESKDMKTPMSLRVMDASGRAIEAKQQIDPSSTIQIGHNYPSGTFYTEVIQGNKRKVVQMIKARG